MYVQEKQAMELDQAASGQENTPEHLIEIVTKNCKDIVDLRAEVNLKFVLVLLEVVGQLGLLFVSFPSHFHSFFLPILFLVMLCLL